MNLQSCIVLKIPRCTVDMLSQILYDKTVDVGKTSSVLNIGDNCMRICQKANTTGRRLVGFKFVSF
jgi:predicted transcriptional regulator